MGQTPGPGRVFLRVVSSGETGFAEDRVRRRRVRAERGDVAQRSERARVGAVRGILGTIVEVVSAQRGCGASAGARKGEREVGEGCGLDASGGGEDRGGREDDAVRADADGGDGI